VEQLACRTLGAVRFSLYAQEDLGSTQQLGL
jgi:hypothetical protein